MSNLEKTHDPGVRFIDYEELVVFSRAVLTAAGLDAYSLDAVVTGLCETSLRGVDSHGVRLLPHYVRSAASGRKNPKPEYRFVKTFPGIGHLDADNAFGHAAGMKAIDLGIEMAQAQGLAAVAVSNSSHPGAMASMAMRAARQGYAAFAFTHADSLVLSHNGTRPYFGTNPVCFAVPRKEQEPYCLDMATSVISWNRLLIHKNNGLSLPEGVAADANGAMTIDPKKATCLMPTGTYKGNGLASMVEVLCGVYTGMAFGRSIPAMYKAPMTEPRHLGQFYMVMRVDGVIDAAEFAARMQQMTDEVRAEPSRPGTRVLLPGDKELHEAKSRRIEGVPLDEATLKNFEELASEYKLSFRLLSI
jgi:ureidoglycolate dehydrogenase (NAD+)